MNSSLRIFLNVIQSLALRAIIALLMALAVTTWGSRLSVAQEKQACEAGTADADSEKLSDAFGSIIDRTERYLDAEAKEVQKKNRRASSVDGTVKLKKGANGGLEANAPADASVAKAPGVLSGYFAESVDVQTILARKVRAWLENPENVEAKNGLMKTAEAWSKDQYGRKYAAKMSPRAREALSVSAVTEVLRLMIEDYDRAGDSKKADLLRQAYEARMRQLDGVLAYLPKPYTPPASQPVAQIEPQIIPEKVPPPPVPEPVVPVVEHKAAVPTPEPTAAPVPVVENSVPESKVPPVIEPVVPAKDASVEKPIQEIVAAKRGIYVPTFGIQTRTYADRPDTILLEFNCACLLGLGTANELDPRDPATAEKVRQKIASEQKRAIEGGYKNVDFNVPCCECDETILARFRKPGLVPGVDPAACEPPTGVIPLENVIPEELPILITRVEPRGLPFPEFKRDESFKKIQPIQLDAVWERGFWLERNRESTREGVTIYGGSSGILPSQTETQVGVGYSRVDQASGTIMRVGILIDPLTRDIIAPGDTRYPVDNHVRYMQPVIQYDLSGVAMGGVRVGSVNTSSSSTTRVSPALEMYYSALVKPNLAYPFSQGGDVSPVGIYGAAYANFAPFLANDKNAAFIAGLGGDIGLGQSDYVRPFVGVATHTFTSPSDPSGNNGHHRGALAVGVDAKWGSLLVKSYYARDPYKDDLESNASATVLANYGVSKNIDLWGVYNYGSNIANSSGKGADAGRLGVNWFFSR